MKQSTHLVLYQGTCRFCNWCRVFVEQRDCTNALRFIALESEAGKEQIATHDLQVTADHPDTIVYLGITEATPLYKWQACMAICEHLTLPMRLLGRMLKIVPTKIGNWLYDWVGRHRNLLCRMVRCPQGEDDTRTS